MPLEPIPKRLTHFGNGSVGSGAESRWFKSSRARHFIIDKKFFKTISIIFFTRFFLSNKYLYESVFYNYFAITT